MYKKSIKPHQPSYTELLYGVILITGLIICKHFLL